MSIEEIAARVEAATGADRELDAEITIAVRGFPERAYQQRNGMRPKGSPDLDRMAFMQDGWAIAYTASLDAAMTLANGLGGQVTFFKDGTAKAFLWQPYPMAVEAKAATPALALTAASLRAIAAMKEPNDGR